MSAPAKQMTEPAIHRARLYSAAQVRELDRRAIGQAGIPGYTLMQRAARAAFELLRQRWPRARRLALLCGPGNNGGDGYEIARLARIAGLDVWLARVGAPPSCGDAVLAHAAFVQAGGEVQDFDAASGAQALATADVIVDAIFGIGIARDVTGIAAQAIAVINARAPRQGVLSVDLPSGLDADDGRVHGVAVRADASIAFIGRKLGAYVGAGPDYAGERHFADLGVPAAIVDAADALADVQDAADLALALPRRARSSHKGRHGHVLVVGGDAGMAGAALLAARGALRSGAGLVSVATRPAHALALTAAQPECMVHGIEHAGAIDDLLRRADAVALGAGLGTGLWGRALFDRCLRSGKPMVLDADALNLLAGAPGVRLAANVVLTPHPGEAARLLGIATEQVQRDRIGAARALRERHGAVIVLKGAGSIVCGERLAICPYGNPGMGVGGMGDVLGGVIAALLGQGLGGERAADIGVLMHALAGDRAAARGGERGLLPGDLVAVLREVVNP